MFNDVISAATALFEFSDRFKEAEEQERERIANHFQKIEQSLLKSAEALENNERSQIDYWWSKLRSYAEALPSIIGQRIGINKANNISNQLTTAIGENSNSSEDISIESLRKLAGMFSALADNVIINRRANTNNSSVFSRNRRAFLSTAFGTSVGLAAGFFSHENTSKVNWNMTTFLTEDYKDLILYEAPQMVCDLVAKMTNDKFTINLNRNGNTETILEDVHQGKIDCGYSGIYYDKPKYRPLFFSSAVPFGLSPQEQNAWLYYKKKADDKLTYIQSIYDKIPLNVIPFPAGGTGGQMGGWFNQPVNSTADFKNITMRIPGLGGDVLDRLGVKIYSKINGSSLKILDIKTKLNNNEIQAAEWIGFHDDYKLELDKVAKYYYYPGWWEPSTTFDVQINKNKWSELPDNYKAILQTACADTHIKILAKYDLNNAEQLQESCRLRTENKIEILRFNDEILQNAKDETNNLFDDYSQNPLFKEVYNEWLDFKARIRRWSNYSNYTQTYELLFEFNPYKTNNLLTDFDTCLNDNSSLY